MPEPIKPREIFPDKDDVVKAEKVFITARKIKVEEKPREGSSTHRTKYARAQKTVRIFVEKAATPGKKEEEPKNKKK